MSAQISRLGDGRVEIRYDDGGFYRGEYKNNSITGQGYFKYPANKTYEGSFKNGAWDGYGKAHFIDDGEIYEGWWKNNLREGHGKTTFMDAAGNATGTWDGEYHDDALDGEATGTWSDGTVIKGRFKGYELVSRGWIRYGKDYFEENLRGWEYDGFMTMDNNWYRWNGEGKLTGLDGTVWEGHFRNDLMDGTFTIRHPDGTDEEAVFSNGRRVDAPKKKTPAEEEPKTAARTEKKAETKPTLTKDTSRFLSAEGGADAALSPDVAKYFEGIIGMRSVKDQLDKMYKRFRIDRMRRSALGISGAKQGYYFIITGNPGTGKTTVARVIGRMLHDLEILPGEVFVEVDRSKLVGQYIGQTAVQTTEVINSARGGTLFIDEAYTLYRKDDDKDFGKEAIDTLLKDMEDHRGEYCVIMAGYKDEMNDMIRNANPGLASRFDHKLNIDDYTTEELTDILVTMADSRSFYIENDAAEVIHARVEKEKVDDTFDNARFARRLLDEAIERQAVRLTENMDSISPEDLQILKASDFGSAGSDLSTLDGCLEKLNGLIGLESVKNEVNRFIRAIRIQNESRKRGLSIADNPLSLNMIFTGNPGTGKTTVARLLSQIYYHLGVLKRPDVFVEVVRADLVGRYQGETAIKAKDVVRRSLGGILFIDEAYSLVMNDSDSFGIEAVNTLVSEIENNRDKLAVIMAGYTREMNEFLDSNPGLRSRLPNVIEFGDYTTEELAAIFRSTLKGRGYRVEVSDDVLIPLIEKEKERRDFGNARGVRNICDRVIARQNERINNMDFSSLSNEVMVTINDSDLDIG